MILAKHTVKAVGDTMLGARLAAALLDAPACPEQDELRELWAPVLQILEASESEEPGEVEPEPTGCCTGWFCG